MDDVISIFSSSPTRDPRPPIDFGVIVITDSEPEDLGNDDPFWAGQKKEIVKVDPLHQYKDPVKEDSPMDIDIQDTVAGPSSRSPAPDTFSDTPVIHAQPEVVPQMNQKADVDPYSKHLALVIEVIPDVQPQHALELIEELYPAYGDQVGQWVVQNLFENPSYPKTEGDVSAKGGGKRKASEMEGAAEESPPRVKIDLATVDRPRPTGKNYRMLALVSCPSVNKPNCSAPS